MSAYPKLPLEEEWHQVIAGSREIKKLAFFACTSKESKEFTDSVKHFNDKLEKLRLSYYFVQYYFNRPGADDMFEYFVENFYIRFFSLWDFIYHLINEFYRFWVDADHGQGFKGDVKRMLLKTDRSLSEFLRSIEQGNSEFRQAKEFRNSIVHQVFPGDPSVEIVRSEWNGRLQTEVKEAVPPQEFMSNIESVTQLLSETLDLLQREFDDTECE